MPRVPNSTRHVKVKGRLPGAQAPSVEESVDDDVVGPNLLTLVIGVSSLVLLSFSLGYWLG
jgi:hypothetical protein